MLFYIQREVMNKDKKPVSTDNDSFVKENQQAVLKMKLLVKVK